MNRQEHWDDIFSNQPVTEVSWFRAHLGTSLALIESAMLDKDAAIIDVGGGASTLVDDLLDRGCTKITVLDISQNALDKTKQRLGRSAEIVT